MKIVVTGGCGFIGSHIADRLVKSGHTVTVLDNLSTGDRRNLTPGAAFREIDVRDAALRDVFREEAPEIVFHLAAQINVRASTEDPVFDTAVNVGGSLSVIQAFCAAPGKKKRLIFASTGGAIYGETDLIPTPETVEPFPLCPYGISKLAVERHLHYFNRFHGLGYTALRFANVYGPRQNALAEAGVIAIFATKMLAGERPVIFGDGHQTRDFVYVQDVVDAAVAAMEHTADGVFNVGTGIETDVVRIFDLVGEAAGARVERTHLPERPGEVRRSALANGKIRETLGWRPRRTIDEGIRETVAWFRAQRNA